MFKLAAFLGLALGTAAHAQENLAPLVWGTNNTGSTQQFAIDHYTSGNILGVPKEDIRVPTTPAVNPRTVIVGVLDTGVDLNHPQLKNRLAGPGYNALSPALDVQDTHGHGTHVSGIIAAELDSTGFQGVSKNVKILPVKVVQTGPNAPIRPQDTTAGAGTALTETVATGLVWAINNGAEVINLSLAWPTSIHSQKVDDAMALAVQKNVIIVSSAGNDSTTADVYPCIYENVVCVGAHGPDGALTHFSNYGSMVDVNAPGISILSTWPLDKTPVTFAGQVGYEFRNGTSMSAPFVTAALAELLARGYSPNEAKARLFLGTRPTSLVHKFSSDVVGHYTANNSTENKVTRFGNIDMTKAISLSPSPLILPKKKGVYELEWDGVSSQITVPITWVNRWAVAASSVKITIQGQDFVFPSLAAGASVDTPFQVTLGAKPDHTFHLTAAVETNGYKKDQIDIMVRIIRTFDVNSLPSRAMVKTIANLPHVPFTGIRSVIAPVGETRADLLFTRVVQLPPTPTPVPTATPVPDPSATPTPVPTRAEIAAAAAAAAAASRGIELNVVQDSNFFKSVTLRGFTEDQLLNLYRLVDGTYVAIFTKPDANVTRPNFLLERLDADLNFVSETKLGTDVTVLSESFYWHPFKGSFTPLWVSLGYTPTADMPAYDPWNPTFRDVKMPRLFYLDKDTLRITKLENDELPLQILPDGRALISKGSNYLQKYYVLTLKDGQIVDKAELSTPEYRMLIGLATGIPTLNLQGSAPKMLAISGASTAGNLRVTGVGSEASFDSILERSSILDALVGVTGAYQDRSKQYYFVQTHYDLQFFTSGSNQTFSTSLNRYSYIPSMIFSRSLFPTVVRDSATGRGLPAIYIPALLANGNVSEVTVADPATGKLYRPAALKLRLKDDSCYEMGNLIQAREGESSKQVFICGNKIVQLPLEI